MLLASFAPLARPPDAFSDDDHEFGSILAAYVAIAVAMAQRHDEVDRREAALHRGLSTRDIIGQAKGILMDANACPPATPSTCCAAHPSGSTANSPTSPSSWQKQENYRHSRRRTVTAANLSNPEPVDVTVGQGVSIDVVQHGARTCRAGFYHAGQPGTSRQWVNIRTGSQRRIFPKTTCSGNSVSFMRQDAKRCVTAQIKLCPRIQTGSWN